MHTYSDTVIGEYIKENYGDLKEISRCDLEDLYMLSKIYNLLLVGDQSYHIIEAMESGENNNPMTYEEFLVRFSEMYKNADTTTKAMVKAEIGRVIA